MNSNGIHPVKTKRPVSALGYHVTTRDRRNAVFRRRAVLAKFPGIA